MNARTLITITIAALFLIGGATAVGAAAPADQAPETASNTSAEPTDDVNGAADSQAPADAEAGVGPSDGLPEQVPDHVRSILDTIQSFQDGEIDTLGDALSSQVGGGPAENAGTAA